MRSKGRETQPAPSCDGTRHLDVLQILPHRLSHDLGTLAIVGQEMWKSPRSFVAQTSNLRFATRASCGARGYG